MQINNLLSYRLLYLILAWLCVALAIIGALLPLMPTTVFLLIAAWAFSKSSKRWHQWLRNHSTFGEIITSWEKHHAMTKRVKYIVFISLLFSYIFTAYLFGPFSLTAIISAICISGVAIYIAHIPVLTSEQLQSSN